MFRPRGLRDRILLWYGGTVLAVLAIVLLLVHMRVGRETSHQVANQMANARGVVESLEQERTSTLARVARLAGKEPKLGAVMATDLRTLEPRHRKDFFRTIDDLLRHDLKPDLEVDFIRVTDARGVALADTSARTTPYTDLGRDEAVATALKGTVLSLIHI